MGVETYFSFWITDAKSWPKGVGAGAHGGKECQWKSIQGHPAIERHDEKAWGNICIEKAFEVTRIRRQACGCFRRTQAVGAVLDDPLSLFANVLCTYRRSSWNTQIGTRVGSWNWMSLRKPMPSCRYLKRIHPSMHELSREYGARTSPVNVCVCLCERGFMNLSLLRAVSGSLYAYLYTGNRWQGRNTQQEASRWPWCPATKARICYRGNVSEKGNNRA